MAFRRQRRQFGGQAFGRLVLEMQAIAEGRLLHLLAHRLQHARIGMADIGDHGAAGAVEIALAVHVPQIDPLRAVEQRAALMRLIEQMGRLVGSPVDVATSWLSGFVR